MKARKYDTSEIEKITQVLFWVLEGVDTDVVAHALHNVAFERKLSGVFFSEEDVRILVKDYLYEKRNETGEIMPDENVIESIANAFMKTNLWSNNLIALESSDILYNKIKTYVNKNFEASDSSLENNEKEN